MAETEEVVFKDKKTNRGWVLNMVKMNEVLLTTSLYDDSGAFMETKAFNLNYESDLEIFRIYLSLFEDNPQKNLQKMLKLTLRK